MGSGRRDAVLSIYSTDVCSVPMRSKSGSMMEAAGIEPCAVLFEKQRRRATFVVKSGKGNELLANSLSAPVPWSPLESSPVVEE